MRRAITVRVSIADKMVADLVGQTVTRVALEQWSVHLVLEGAVLNVEGHWKLLDADDVVVDFDCKHAERRAFLLWQLIGTRIIDSGLAPGNALYLVSDVGFRLEADADTDGFEDWQLSLTDGSMIIVNGNDMTEFGPRT
jgi:hypothetical protein